jgi:hypothetical protein
VVFGRQVDFHARHLFDSIVAPFVPPVRDRAIDEGEVFLPWGRAS